MTEYCNMLGCDCPHEVKVTNQAFIMMAYKRGEKLEETFKDVIRNEYKLKPVIAKQVKVRASTVMFCTKICQEIKKSLICFADVSRPNTNVGFELGIAAKYNKPSFYTMNKRVQRYPPSDLVALYGLWYNNYADLKKKMVEEIDINWIRKIKRERSQDKKNQLLLRMLEKYRAKSPPAV